jgi:ribosomal protein L11 methyltransferase
MRELVIQSAQAQAEALCDALLEAGALSVSVEDADSNTEHEAPLFGEPGAEPAIQAWGRNCVIALLPEQTSADSLLAAAGLAHGGLTWVEREVPDADWVRLTQAQFVPIHIGERIWIVPSWHRNDVAPERSQADQIHIELDPGLAFGTGSHPTTHLCAQWLAGEMPVSAEVLDYGCGSGILAIIAAKLGAPRVVGVDIDEQAVAATFDNAQNNHCVVTAYLPADLPDGQYGVVVANILSNPLKILAPMLAHRVTRGGRLVLSGVLARQADEVAVAYAPWLALSVWAERDGWVCLHGSKA